MVRLLFHLDDIDAKYILLYDQVTLPREVISPSIVVILCDRNYLQLLRVLVEHANPVDGDVDDHKSYLRKHVSCELHVLAKPRVRWHVEVSIIQAEIRA